MRCSTAGPGAAGRQARRARKGRRMKRIERLSVTAPLALITPALFSQSPPLPPGEEGGVSLKKKIEAELSLALSLPAVGGEAGRERVGRVRTRPGGAPAMPGGLDPDLDPIMPFMTTTIPPQQRIEADVKAALKAGEKEKLSTLRMLLG